MLPNWEAQTSRSTMFRVVPILLCCCLSTEGFKGPQVPATDNRVMGLPTKVREAFQNIKYDMDDIFNTGMVSYKQGMNIMSNMEDVFKHANANQSVQVSNLVLHDLERGNPRGVIARYIEEFLQKIPEMGGKQSKMIQEAEKTKSLIQDEENRDFPKQPNFFESLFGAAPGAKPYSDYGSKLQGMFSTGNKIVKGMDDVISEPKNDISNLFSGSNSSTSDKVNTAGGIISGVGDVIKNLLGSKNNNSDNNSTAGKIVNGIGVVGDLVSGFTGKKTKNETVGEKTEVAGDALSKIGSLVSGIGGKNSTTLGKAISGLGDILSAASNRSNGTEEKGKGLGAAVGGLVSEFSGNKTNGTNAGKTVSNVVGGLASLFGGIADLVKKDKSPKNNRPENASGNHNIATTTESGFQKFADWFG